MAKISGHEWSWKNIVKLRKDIKFCVVHTSNKDKTSENNKIEDNGIIFNQEMNIKFFHRTKSE